MRFDARAQNTVKNCQNKRLEICPIKVTLQMQGWKQKITHVVYKIE